MRPSRVGTVVALALATMFAGSATALASGTLSVPGATATYSTPLNRFTITDTGADRHNVYVQYQVVGYPPVKLFNTSGRGTTVNRYLAERYNNMRMKWQVCVLKPGPDRCSGWKWDTI